MKKIIKTLAVLCLSYAILHSSYFSALDVKLTILAPHIINDFLKHNIEYISSNSVGH